MSEIQQPTRAGLWQTLSSSWTVMTRAPVAASVITDVPRLNPRMLPRRTAEAASASEMTPDTRNDPSTPCQDDVTRPTAPPAWSCSTSSAVPPPFPKFVVAISARLKSAWCLRRLPAGGWAVPMKLSTIRARKF